jgi:hypothetical protein
MSDSKSANLFINGRLVGRVRMTGSDSAWGYGHFDPADSFGDFAPLFGAWSLLMHVDDSEPRLSNTAAEELRRAEEAIDQLRVELRWPFDGSVTRIMELNIEGHSIEWKAADD